MKDAFAKNLDLNILLDAEISMLRDTIRYGLQNGDWDMKVGERIYIKTDGKLSLPETIEFSDRKVKEIESIEISVDKLIDYRKLGTAIPLLSRFPLKG